MLEENIKNCSPSQGMAIPCGGTGAALPVRDAYSIDNPVEGVLVGTAVGDSLGLPAEGLSPQRIAKNGWSSWHHRFFVGKGMISDDTEHTLFVAQAILRYPDNVHQFQRCLASKLRWWLVSLPAGTGLATARAILKLWCGVSPRKSGVFSAGNGPAMRSAVIGVTFANDPDKLYEYVKASTQLTHSDPRALTGALAVAHVASYLTNEGAVDPSFLLKHLKALSFFEQEWIEIIEKMEVSLENELSVKDFCRVLKLEKGVTGYIYHTVPVAIYSLLLNEADFEKSLTDVLSCGGDADTTGAIVGSMLGACGKKALIPNEWVEDIIEWPRSISLLKRVALQINKLKSGSSYAPISYFVPLLLLRNFVFLVIVLSHGLMRLLPSFLMRRLIK